MTEYTAEELVTILRDEGLPASARQLRDWVDIGLVNGPSRGGRGDGGGRGSRAGLYSENDKLMYRHLLRQRVRGASITSLLNVPVWMWLRHGDEYASTDQVRRCLAEWDDRRRTTPAVRARKLSREVTATLAHRAAKDRVQRSLRVEIANQLQTGDTDPDAIFRAAKDVIDQPRHGPRGPAEAALTSKVYRDVVRARQAGRAVLKSADGSLLDTARGAYRSATVSYGDRQPRLANDPDTGHLFTERSVEVEVNSACEDLLLLLGLASHNSHGSGTDHRR